MHHSEWRMKTILVIKKRAGRMLSIWRIRKKKGLYLSSEYRTKISLNLIKLRLCFLDHPGTGPIDNFLPIRRKTKHPEKKKYGGLTQNRRIWAVFIPSFLIPLPFCFFFSQFFSSSAFWFSGAKRRKAKTQLSFPLR